MLLPAKRAAFLAEASAILSSSLDHEAILDRIARMAVPIVADFCVIDLLENGSSRRVVAAHSDPSRETFAHALGEPIISRRVVALGRAEVRNAPDQAEDDPAIRSWICAPLLARGEVLGALTFLMAESNRRYHEEDLPLFEELGRRAGVAIDNARLYREAQNAIQMRDDFLLVAAHELRTPLTSLKLYLQSLERAAADDGLTARGAQKLARAITQTDRLNQLVDTLLDVAHISSGRPSFSLERKRFDLCAAVCDVVDRFRDSPQCRSRMTIEARGPVMGTWDPIRIDQILTNLVSNACKYGNEEPIKISVEARAGVAVVEVEDRGIGISPSDAERIFECYERAVSSRNYGGLGLGLYITRQLALAHGGTIRVESQPGAGATFILELPLGSSASA